MIHEFQEEEIEKRKPRIIRPDKYKEPEPEAVQAFTEEMDYVLEDMKILLQNNMADLDDYETAYEEINRLVEEAIYNLPESESGSVESYARGMLQYLNNVWHKYFRPV